MSVHTKLPSLEARKTPFYAYNLSLLNQTIDTCSAEAKRYNFHVHYALKANSNARILQQFISKGFGADCVSGNEVKAAYAAGFKCEDIVFAGVGKSDTEINAALDLAIRCFNCESIQEIEVINELAAAKGKVASIALRINPNVNANTHHYITTGLEENKFGINQIQLPDLLEQLTKLSHIKLIGLHFHIGSQIIDLDVFKNLCTRVNEFTAWFEQRKVHLEIINVGGGLGIDYDKPDAKPIPDFEKYFAIFNSFLNRRPHQEVHFEIGRSLVGQCGDLISRVLYVKSAIKTQFAILDAGMTELLRPALYQAKHSIVNLSGADREVKLYDVVGPVCESSDSFGKALNLPEMRRGDLVAIRSAGAYGEVMASRYNLRELEEELYY